MGYIIKGDVGPQDDMERIYTLFSAEFDKHTIEDKEILHLYFDTTDERRLVDKMLDQSVDSLDDIINDPYCSDFTIRYTPDEIQEKRQSIHAQFIDLNTRVSESRIQELLKEYDTHFFSGRLFQLIDKYKYDVIIRTQGKPTFNTEGFCIDTICHYTITLPRSVIRKFKPGHIVAGQRCKDKTECILFALEHELVHLIIFLFCRSSDLSDYHGILFQKMARDLFGHTSIYHSIS